MAWNTPYFEELPDDPAYVGVVTGFDQAYIGNEQKLKFNINVTITEGVFIDAPHEIGFLPETGMGENIFKGIIRKIILAENPHHQIGPNDHLCAGNSTQAALSWVQQKLYGSVVVFEVKTCGKYKNSFIHEVRSMAAPQVQQPHQAPVQYQQPTQQQHAPSQVTYSQGTVGGGVMPASAGI